MGRAAALEDRTTAHPRDEAGHRRPRPFVVGGAADRRGCYGRIRGAAHRDACHLCFETRLALRDRFPDVLAPAVCYGPAGA